MAVSGVGGALFDENKDENAANFSPPVDGLESASSSLSSPASTSEKQEGTGIGTGDIDPNAG